MFVPPSGFTTPDFTKTEGDVAPQEVCVALSGFNVVLCRPITINLRSVDGTATSKVLH